MLTTVRRLSLFLLCLALAGCERGRGNVATPPPAAAPADMDTAGAVSPGAEAAPPAPATVQGDSGEAGDHLLLGMPYDGRRYPGVEPIAVVKPSGELRRAAVSLVRPTPLARRWLDPGHAYTLLHRGRPAGRVVVSRPGGECLARAALRIRGRPAPQTWDALATDLDAPPGPPLRRGATAAERRAMTALLRDSVVAHGEWDDEARIEVDAVPLAGGGVALVGSAYLRRNDFMQEPAWGAFIVAEREGAAYRPSIGWLEDGDDEVYAASLLDVIDIDRDGVPEIVTRAHASWGQKYTILARGAAGWSVVFETSGC